LSSEAPAWARHDPAAWTRTLAYRDRRDVPHYGSVWPAGATLMLDTTVYLDGQRRGRLPADLAARIASAPLIHSAVALSELTANLGLLDPAHPNTPRVRAVIEETLSRIPPERIVQPSIDAWLEGSLITGILARIQGLPAADRRKRLNDALIFISAGEAGAVLVSRDKADIDLLLNFRSDIRVWLYKFEADSRAPRAGRTPD
jgi:hypothetical protein